MNAVYNEIGKTYDVTRKADPEIARVILDALEPKAKGRFLDLGCGSGNYTEAFFRQGYDFCGLDISSEMLDKAKNKQPEIRWILGDATNLPFEEKAFDGMTCILATHHIKDLKTAFQEAFRVMQAGKFVIFTAFPDQMQHYWLNHYFPENMQQATRIMHTWTEMADSLQTAGFHNVRRIPFFVTNSLQDLFLHAGKYRPEIYLDERVRAGISTFALAKNKLEVLHGCARLQADITSGIIQEVIKTYESAEGDYAFVVCSA